MELKEWNVLTLIECLLNISHGVEQSPSLQATNTYDPRTRSLRAFVLYNKRLETG